MKKTALLILATVITSFAAQAEIREVKFNVSSRIYNANGDTIKLVNTRAFVRYNSEANILSEEAKSDCFVFSGKKDLLSLWSNDDRTGCISNKTYVVASEEIVKDMFYRPATFQLFRDNLTDISNIIEDDGVITSKTENDLGITGSVRSSIRNLLNKAAKTQTISLTGMTQFTLKGNGPAKMIIELNPVSETVLNQ